MARSPAPALDPKSVISFAPAVRSDDRLLIFVYALSGGGKTFSALKLARGLAGGNMKKVFVIDTEENRALVFADDPEVGGFMHGPLPPPFTPERYVAAIEGAEAAGAEVVVIDSLSHEWDDIGGVLELRDAEERRGMKGLGMWADPKARHKRFVRKLTRTKCHLIGCMRGKDKYKLVEQEKNGQKQQVPVLVGLAQVADPKLIFEATVQVKLAFPETPPGVPTIEKCPDTLRAAFLDGEPITVETGARLRQWAKGKGIADPVTQLRRDGENVADRFGTERLRQWWLSLTRTQQQKLKPYADALGALAREADERIAGEKLERQQEVRFDNGQPAASPFKRETAAEWAARRVREIQGMTAEEVLSFRDHVALELEDRGQEDAAAAESVAAEIERAIGKGAA